jgi:hypothetical protein
MDAAIAFAKKYRVHLYVGEFSTIRWAPGAEDYLRDAIEIFEKHGWDWSYHAYREWHGWNLELGTNRDDMTRGLRAPRLDQARCLAPRGLPRGRGARRREVAVRGLAQISDWAKSQALQRMRPSVIELP